MVPRMSFFTKQRAWTFKRAGNLDANPTQFAQRSTSFATSATTRFNSVTLIAKRDDTGVRGYLVSGDWKGMDNAALALAQAVGAKVERVDEAPDLTGPACFVVGRLDYQEGLSGGLIQAGANPADVIRTLAPSMPPGSWVGVSLRRPSQMEKQRWYEWLATRPTSSQSHHTRQTTYPVVASLYAATGTRAQTRSLLNQLAGVLPGFDMNVGTQVPSRWGATLVPFVFPAVFAALMFLPTVVGLAAPEYVGNLPVISASVVARAAGLAAVFAALIGFGVIPSRWSRLRKAIRNGYLPRPYHRLFPAKKGRVDDFQHMSRMGEYPLDKRAFMMAPHLVTTLVAPHAGALSGSSSTRVRAIPSVVSERIGPLVGDADGIPVYLSAADSQHGVAIVGRPGAGKSILLNNIAAWSMCERVRPSGLPGFPGADNTLIIFEPKLDGAEAYRAWGDSTGDKVTVVEVANPEGVAVDFFDVPGTVNDRAEFFTEALRYAFDDGAIQGASAEALRATLAGGLVVTDDMVDVLHRGPEGSDPITDVAKGRSPIYYTHVLLGSLGDRAAVALAQQITNHANAALSEGDEFADVVLANAKLSPIFSGRTPAQRATYCQAPRNKLDALASVEHFFRPGREKVTWRSILTGHKAVVILTGVDSEGHMMSTTAERLMSSLLMYSLRDAIERTCSGWESRNRWTSVFVDELSMIAGSDPEIITWLKNRGRSYGVRPFFATQYPNQLNQQVREAFLAFSALVTFTLEHPAVAHDVVADLSGDGTDWTVADVLELAPYHAIVRTNVNRQRQPAFSFRAYFWSSNEQTRAEFVRAQGY